jgi:hypothetical protein
MRFKTAVLLFLLSPGVLPVLQNLSAQDAKQNTSPLIVTIQFPFIAVADCKEGGGLLVRFQLTGAKPLRGYLVRLIFTDPQSGKSILEQHLEEIRNPLEDAIPAGDLWTSSLCALPKKFGDGRITVNAKIDVLKFADGSVWGPLTLRESHVLVGTVDGMDFSGKSTELQGFVSPILPQQGPAPVEHIQSQSVGPLRIESGVWRDESGKEMLAMQVTNEGEAPIRGYLFMTTFFDPDTGERLRRFSTKELETHGNPDDYLAPGFSWIADPRKFSFLANGTLASYKIDLDLVVFADGSMVGPKKSQESDEVLGILKGIDDAKRINQEIAE